MAPFSYEKKCFNCFKKLEVSLDHSIFDGPSTSAAVNIQHQETTIDLIEEIDNLHIKVSFCNEECKNVGESELKKCTAHLMTLKEDTLKMESELPDHIPARFDAHDGIDTHGRNGECYDEFEWTTCTQFYGVSHEDISDESDESDYFDSDAEDEDWAREHAERNAIKEFKNNKFLPIIKKKQSYAFTIGFLADRINNRELYELHLQLLPKILQQSSYGFCEMFVSLLVTLLNLDRVEEAYKMIMFRFFHNLSRKNIHYKYWADFGPPNWFEDDSDGKQFSF